MSWARNSRPAGGGFSLGLPSSLTARSSLVVAANGCLSSRGPSKDLTPRRTIAGDLTPCLSSRGPSKDLTPRRAIAGDLTPRTIAGGFLEAAEGFSNDLASGAGAPSCRTQAGRDIAAICVQIGQEAALKSRGSRDAFRFVDADRGGSITRGEVRCFFRAYNVSEQDADKFFNCLDRDYTGQVDYRVFLKLVGPYVQAGDDQARKGSKESCSTEVSDTDLRLDDLPGMLQEGKAPVEERSRTWPIAGRSDDGLDLEHMARVIGDKVALKYSTFRDCFRALDTDKDGTVSRQDLRAFFAHCCLPVKSADSFFTAMDKDGSGTVDYVEFMAMFGPVIQPGYQERSAQDLRSAPRPSIWRVS